MSRKKVLIYCGLSEIGGVETHVYQLSRLLASRSVDVVVAARYLALGPDFVRELRDAGVQIVTTPVPDRRWLKPVANACAFVLWSLQLPLHSFDVVLLCHGGGFGRFMRHWVKPNQGWLIYHEATMGISPDGSPPGARHIQMLRSVDAVTVNAKPVKDALRKYVPSNTPIKVVPALSAVKEMPRRPIQTAAEPNRCLHLSFLGTIGKTKGVYVLLDIWPELNIQPARLNFYGQGEVERLKREIAKRGLEDQVFVHGPYDHRLDLSKIMEQTSFVVLPTFAEGLGLVLIEAMAHGVPFVATGVGGLPDLAEDNPDVLLVPLEREAIKDGIKEMAHRVRSGQISPTRLQRYYNERFSYQAVGDRWLHALLESETFWRETQ